MNRFGLTLTLFLLATTCGRGESTTEALTVGTTTEQPDSSEGPLPGWPEGAASAIKALYAGSWTPDGAEGFDEQWIDEAALVETYTMRRAGRRFWSGLRSADGVLPVNVLVHDREGPAVTYLYVLNYRRPDDPSADMTTLEYDDEPAVLHLRYRGRARLLFDGEVVIDVPAPPAGEVGEARAAVTMTGGFDVVLVKLGRGSNELGWSFDCELRMSDLQGEKIDKQGWNTMRASDVLSELVDQPPADEEPGAPPPR